MIESRLFYFHNPKAGGTSVRHAIEALFSDGDIAPLVENTEPGFRRNGGDYSAFRGYRYYGGHYGSNIFDAVNDGHDCVTNLRKSDSRLLSLYNYFMVDVEIPDDPSLYEQFHAVRFAQTVDFHTFVASEDPLVEVYTRNHLVRQLSGSAWDVRSTGDLSQAAAMIDRMRWFYVCEEPALSWRWAQDAFGGLLPPIARDNVTSRAKGGRVAVTSMSDETRAVILAKNTLDTALYDYALRRLHEGRAAA
ncbi:hypothetical protein [Azorhizobium sp. AG788]|uniref:hypothetical protein n=1 Tax=Azorhizobium sp. AG788 TaxID=2183897 RepID=UPI0031391751